ncbi:MAG TPA: hypothetical protein VGH40_10615 [Roseiarcus sp.]|jgi:hypothetical protein
MNPTFDAREAARFLRSLRVATQTALALDEMERARRTARPATSFAALAAKGAEDWRFPAAGVLSGDGLVLAELLCETEDGETLALQAQGAAGLATYAGRSVRVRLGETASVEAAFDRNGGLRIPLAPHSVSEADLATLAIDLLDGAP